MRVQIWSSLLKHLVEPDYSIHLNARLMTVCSSLRLAEKESQSVCPLLLVHKTENRIVIVRVLGHSQTAVEDSSNKR